MKYHPLLYNENMHYLLEKSIFKEVIGTTGMPVFIKLIITCLHKFLYCLKLSRIKPMTSGFSEMDYWCQHKHTKQPIFVNI